MPHLAGQGRGKMTDTSTIHSPRLLDVQQLAKHLRVSPKFLYERTSPNCPRPIPHYKLGKFVRFRLEEVEKWLADQAR